MGRVMGNTVNKRGLYRATDPDCKYAAVAGVTAEHTPECDCYTGRAEALIQAGIVEQHELPGQPGLGAGSVCYRPLGVDRIAGRGWFITPGFMTIRRLPSNAFKVTIRVSGAETGRREAQQRARRDQAGSEQAALAQTVGLEVQHYSPRLSKFAGSAGQLLKARVLPHGFVLPPASPADDGGGFASHCWRDGHLRFWLSKKAVSAAAMRCNDYRSDYWELAVIDERYPHSDNLVELRRAELARASKPGKGFPH